MLLVLLLFHLLGLITFTSGVQAALLPVPLFGWHVKPHRSFLDSTYKVKDNSKLEFCVRQVPGDGSCLFHAISAWLSFLQTNKHKDFDWRMRGLSLKLRHLAVNILQQPNTTLTLEDGELITTTQLVDVIAEQYNIKPAEYCASMLDPRTWGGGPEIVALSHHFKCPIHVYQLSANRSFLRPFSTQHFQLEICGKFGSPTFDAKDPIYILCADGRFPHIAPGKQKAQGDHFLALFPVSQVADNVRHLVSADTTRHSNRLKSSSNHTQSKLSADLPHGSRRVAFPRSLSFMNRHKPTDEARRASSCLIEDCPELLSDDMFREWVHEASAPLMRMNRISNAVRGWWNGFFATSRNA